jgi:hypothetical protein
VGEDDKRAFGHEGRDPPKIKLRKKASSVLDYSVTVIMPPKPKRSQAYTALKKAQVTAQPTKAAQRCKQQVVRNDSDSPSDNFTKQSQK